MHERVWLSISFCCVFGLAVCVLRFGRPLICRHHPKAQFFLILFCCFITCQHEWKVPFVYVAGGFNEHTDNPIYLLLIALSRQRTNMVVDVPMYSVYRFMWHKTFIHKTLACDIKRLYTTHINALTIYVVRSQVAKEHPLLFHDNHSMHASTSENMLLHADLVRFILGSFCRERAGRSS